MPAMGCRLCIVVARIFLVSYWVPFVRGFECDFKEPNCGWTWSNGFALVTAQNPSLGNTAPSTDAHNNAEGSFLYYSSGSNVGMETRIEVTSPQFKPGTKENCYLHFYLHMYNMDQTEFKMVIEAPNITLESGSFEGNSGHKWEKHKEMIGAIDQPFHVVLEVTEKLSAVPSHLAIDDIRVIDCYDTETEASAECGVRQFQCSDRICLDAHQVCDVTVDCVEEEDETQKCEQLPEATYCTFETGTCGWNSSKTDNSTWVRHSGVSPNKRTGPSFDHTFQNSTGVYLLAKFPSGRAFGHQTTLRSPLFDPPPIYHSDKFSPYFNSCQVRFYYHKYGQYVGELRLYSVEMVPRSTKPKIVELWRSFGDQGDVWRKTVVSLPPLNRKFYLEFSASRGVRHSDIAIDDVTLSRECFGLGVPDNVTKWTTTEAPNVATSSMTPFTIKNYTFGTCGARGRYGPKPEQCSEAYRDTSVHVEVGTEPGLEGIQMWKVPTDGIYTLFLRGAGGGIGDANHHSSRGSSIRATFHWKEGDVIRIAVGQKGVSACSLDLGTCSHQNNISKSLFSRKIFGSDEGGGGGGGATVVYKVDPLNFSKILLAVASGGGGLSAKKQPNPLLTVNPNGMGINSSTEPRSGFSGKGAGGGGGWNGTTVLPSGGQSLHEGGHGGSVCEKLQSWATNGGFGGGGGACAGGGGGGGYRGGDASQEDNPLANGQGGTSYVNSTGRFVSVEPGVNEGDGSLVVIPTHKGCGCDHLCDLLDLDNQTFHCLCPDGLALGADGFSCEALIVTELSDDERGISTRHLVVIILCVVVIIGVFLFFSVLGLNRYRKQQSRDLSHEPLNNPEMQLSRLRRATGGMVTEYNPNYEFGGSTCTVQDLREVPREHLTLVKALGQGAFGEVYQGYLTGASDNTEKPVAVKTLPELSASQAEMDFLMEALIMSKFNHPNIVSFIGVCFEKMPRFIVLELLPGGDLKSYLRECRPKPQKPSTLTLTDLLLLAMDVAKGCEYLEENHFIHRDIAARNCLLTTKDEDRVVKIADFGMARDIYRADYYRKGGKAMLPVKWMPPEAFLDGIFTSKTDVWSFGVLLWEVISLGYMPYPGRGNQEVMQLVTSGGRLEPPTNCPNPVYHIMMQCWHPLPDERPNFFTIIERLGYCLQDPDVINAPLPVFNRPPSMERDATVMRPPDADNGGCLRVHRPDPGVLLSPGSEDYLIPMPQSTYSMTTDRTDLQSSPSLGSVDQLLELEDRSTDASPSKPPEWNETNFMTPDTPTDVTTNPLNQSVTEWNGIDNPAPQTSPAQLHQGQPLKKRAGGYTEVPTEEEAPSLPSSNDLNNPGRRGMPTSGVKMMANRVSSIKSLDALPVAPEVVNENEVSKLKTPSAASTNHSNLSLDPGALSRQLGSNPPRRYMNIDVNCNSGEGVGTSNSLSSTRTGSFDQNVANHNVGPFDGYAGVNPVA